MMVGGRLRAGRCALALMGAVMLAAGSALATPSGLNNIPTADVVPAGVLVWQSFAELGEDRAPAWFAGVKYGPAENWEVGLDDAVAGGGSAGGPTLQVKCRRALGDRGAFAVGAANISDDRARHGEVFPYFVSSASLGTARGHLGYSWQSDNRAWFVGADSAVNRRATLRADWIQTADGDEHMSSLGFIGALSARWLVEGWASFPSAEGAETGYVLKLNWVMPLHRF